MLPAAAAAAGTAADQLISRATAIRDGEREKIALIFTRDNTAGRQAGGRTMRDGRKEERVTITAGYCGWRLNHRLELSY